MRHRLSLIPILLALLVAFAGAPSAAQADYREVYTDCNDGTIDGNFTAKELRQALQNADANTGDYSECADAIVQAQQAQAGGTKSTGGPKSGTTNTTPAPGGTAAAPSTTGTPAPAGGATPSTGATTTGTTTPDRQNDARDADVAERNAALAAATASADKQAQKTAADLKATGVPAAAVELGGNDTSLPGPLLLTLVACVVAACIAGGATGFQAYRRRRGR